MTTCHKKTIIPLKSDNTATHNQTEQTRVPPRKERKKEKHTQ